MRLKVSQHIFIDSTFHHPPNFYQFLILMYKDIITGIKMPGIYVLMNSKEEVLYLWNKMTPANTSIAWIKLGDETIQVLTGLIVDGLQISYNKDDTYTVHFYFYNASFSKDVDQEYVQAAKILLGEE